MKTTKFKVMVWLRKIREKQAADVADKSMEERLAYYRRQAQPLRAKYQPREKIAA